MGSSDAAGTRGKPATPRDGSAVELVGLCKAAVRFLAKMHREGHYPHSGVSRTNKDGMWSTDYMRVQLIFVNSHLVIEERPWRGLWIC